MTGPGPDARTDPRDQPNDARDQAAVFAPTSVRTGGRPPFLAIGLAAGLVTLIGYGLVSGQGGQDATGLPPSSELSAEIATPIIVGSRPVNRPPHRSLPTAAPRASRLPGPVTVDLRPAGSHLFVHGEVYSDEVARVVISVEDNVGHIASQQTIRLPLDARPGPPVGGQFDLEFDIPDEVMGEGLWVVASSWDQSGVALEPSSWPVVVAARRRLDLAPGPAEPTSLQSPAAMPSLDSLSWPGLGQDFGSAR